MKRSDRWQLELIFDAALELHTEGLPQLEPFRAALLTLPHEEVIALRREFDAVQKKQEKEEARGRKEAAAAAPPIGGDGIWTLRQEKVLCGKANCAKLHGPYWYGYRTLGQRTKKKYFGKKKPGPAKLAAAAAAMLQKKEQERAEAAAAKKKKKTAGKR